MSILTPQSIPWHKRLSFRLMGSFAFALIVAAVILNVVFWGQARPWLEYEAIKYNRLVGQNLVHALSEQTRGIEGVTRSLAVTAMNEFGDPHAIIGSAPSLFDAPSYRDDVLGGGVWPAPFTWDPIIERSSFFWGRTLSGDLQLYDDYNISPRGYTHEEWYVPTQHMDNGQIYWSRSYTDPISLEPMVTSASPLYFDGFNVGAVTVDISLNNVNALVKRAMQGSAGYAYILDRSNRFISFPSRDWIRTRRPQTHKDQSIEDLLTADELAARHPMFLPHLELIKLSNLHLAEEPSHSKNDHYWLTQQLIANSDLLTFQEASKIADYIHDYELYSSMRPIEVYRGSISHDWLLSEPVIVTIFSMPNTQWSIITVSPLSEAFAFAQKMSLSASVVISLVILLIGFMIIFFLKKDLLDRLMNMATSLSHPPNQSHTDFIKVVGDDELSLLGKLFNEKTQDLIEARKVAEHSERSKTLFLGTISHEFRTPLNSILGFSQFLEKRLTQQVDVKYLEALRSIHTNGQSLLKMINRVIEVSQLEAGKTPFKPQKTNISSWLRGVIYDVNTRLNERHIDMVFSEPNGEEEMYFLDTTLLTKALEQILENSLEATIEGKVFISWKTKKTHQETYLKIMIRDTGRGIPREKLNQLFQRFTNLNEELGSGFGAGLGLYLSKLCIERHKGSIHISSIENSGTTVSITLPGEVVMLSPRNL